MQNASGELTYHQLIAVSFFQSGDQQPGFYRAVIYKKGLQISAGTGIGGLGNITGKGVVFTTAFQLCHFAALAAIYAVNRGL